MIQEEVAGVNVVCVMTEIERVLFVGERIEVVHDPNLERIPQSDIIAEAECVGKHVTNLRQDRTEFVEVRMTAHVSEEAL